VTAVQLQTGSRRTHRLTPHPHSSQYRRAAQICRTAGSSHDRSPTRSDLASRDQREPGGQRRSGRQAERLLGLPTTTRRVGGSGLRDCGCRVGLWESGWCKAGLCWAFHHLRLEMIISISLLGYISGSSGSIWTTRWACHWIGI
jgi:hypothetical protein